MTVRLIDAEGNTADVPLDQIGSHMARGWMQDRSHPKPAQTVAKPTTETVAKPAVEATAMRDPNVVAELAMGPSYTQQHPIQTVAKTATKETK